MKKLIFAACLCLLWGNVSGQWRSGDFAACDYSAGRVIVVEQGEITWHHPAAESNDIWVLTNGNILFTNGHGVMEISRLGDTLFHYESQSSVFACQRLPNGNTFIGESSAGRLIEVSPDMRIVSSVSILPQGQTKASDSFMRNARRLPNGNYLVAHYGPRSVKEYGPDGRVVWGIDLPAGAHSAVRLPNGNTMVAITDGDKDPKLVEFRPDGSVAWELSNRDIEGKPLKFVSGFQCLDNGTIVLTNWIGHTGSDQGAHLLMVDRNKKVIDMVSTTPWITTLSSVQMLSTAADAVVLH